MKTFLILLLYVSVLLSQDKLSVRNYPKLYSQLGTPLFELADDFEILAQIPLFQNDKQILMAYLKKVKLTIEAGLIIDAEDAHRSERAKSYLKELRELQKLHDKIESSYKKQLYKSIRDDDQDTFYTLSATPLPFISTDARLKEEVVKYYQKTQQHYISSSQRQYDFTYLKDLSQDLRLDQQSYAYMQTAFKASLQDQEVEKRDAITQFIPDAHKDQPVQVISVRTKKGFDLYLENHAYFDVTIELKTTKLINLSSSEPLPFVGSFPAQSRTKILNFSVQDPQQQSQFQTFFNATVGRINTQYDDEYLYALPFARGESYQLTQGFNGRHTHKDQSAYALDFKMDEGTRIHAMREGVVVALEEKQTEHGYSPAFAEKSNHIIIQHDDGTMAMYGHLQPNGVKVRLGQKVYKHAFIGLSGNTGYTSGPHLHVHISVLKDLKTGPVSVPFKFLAQRGKIDSPKEMTSYTAK
jgi:murein DD-endopeptidase MepM/ murein hydrolase activator NlpD